MIKDDILTLDNLLHTLLGALILFWAWFYPPVAAAMGLYLREQGQHSSNSKDWTLGWSFHKHAEWFVPGIALIAVWEIAKATLYVH